MFRAAYEDEFYIALRNALHAEVNSWSNRNAQEAVDVDLLWQQVFDLEPKTRNTEATSFARGSSLRRSRWHVCSSARISRRREADINA